MDYDKYYSHALMRGAREVRSRIEGCVRPIIRNQIWEDVEWDVMEGLLRADMFVLELLVEEFGNYD